MGCKNVKFSEVKKVESKDYREHGKQDHKDYQNYIEWKDPFFRFQNLFRRI